MKESTWNHIIAVTNRRLSVRPYLEQIERICSRHPRALLVREKDLTEEEYGRLAGSVYEICRKYHVLCIYHSFVHKAFEMGAKSVHLPLPLLKKAGQDPVLKSFEAVGASVHSAEEAREAVALGASYLTAGHIYTTDCKKGLPPRGLSFLQEVCRTADLPVYAIGGIHTEEQIAEVMAAGAAGACIMSGAMRI